MKGACICLAAFAGVVGAVGDTCFPASLEFETEICRAARRGLRPVVCLQPPSLNDKAPGLSIQEQGNKQSMRVCACLCVLEGL